MFDKKEILSKTKRKQSKTCDKEEQAAKTHKETRDYTPISSYMRMRNITYWQIIYPIQSFRKRLRKREKQELLTNLN